jgi:hypothetical protein
MINADMRNYNYYLYRENDYGQSIVPTGAEPAGTVKMAIYTTSQSTQDNILYKNASYVAITHNTEVNDTYQIDYNGERLKVLYVSPQGRFRRVFLEKVG